MAALATIAIGFEAPRTVFDGVVCGNFDRACNIRLKDGCLVTLGVADYFDMPRGIRVKTANGFRFNAMPLAGASAHLRAGMLRFSNCDLKIDLRNAPVWDQRFEPVAPPPASLIRRLWRTAFDRSPLATQALPILGHEASVKTLIGRGPGLTPAGDDLLTGFLAAAMLVAPGSPPSRAFIRQINRHLGATNEISRQMLSDATRGFFIAPVIAMMSALYGTGCIAASTQNLLRLGESSGAAMLLGILAGVARVENHGNPGRLKAA